MGQTCEPCCQNDYNDTTQHIRSSSEISTRIRRSPSKPVDYDADESDFDDQDSASVSSKIEYADMTEHEIDTAFKGWKNAVETGNNSLARYFIETYPNMDFFQYYWDDGSSSLQIACKNRKAPLVFLFLTQGVNVNEQNPETRDTALHIAVRVRDEKIVDLLLKWDADPNIGDKQNETAISLSYQYKDKDIYLRIVGSDQAYTPQPGSQDDISTFGM